jgi:hypothetical protein
MQNPKTTDLRTVKFKNNSTLNPQNFMPTPHASDFDPCFLKFEFLSA